MQQSLGICLTGRGTLAPMGTDHIVALLIAERDKLNQAISALQRSTARPGRPPTIAVAGEGQRAKRHVSAAARRKMAAAQKRRWAKIKAAAK